MHYYLRQFFHLCNFVSEGNEWSLVVMVNLMGRLGPSRLPVQPIPPLPFAELIDDDQYMLLLLRYNLFGVLGTETTPSAKFQVPANGDTIAANTESTVSLAIQNIETGNFVNAQEDYFAAPQQLTITELRVIGHRLLCLAARDIHSVLSSPSDLEGSSNESKYTLLEALPFIAMSVFTREMELCIALEYAAMNDLKRLEVSLSVFERFAVS